MNVKERVTDTESVLPLVNIVRVIPTYDTAVFLHVPVFFFFQNLTNRQRRMSLRQSGNM